MNLVKMLSLAPSEIKQLILGHLDYISRDALSRTCLEACPIVGGQVTLWDLTTGQFYESEYTAEEFKNLKDAGEVAETAEQHGDKVSDEIQYHRYTNYRLLVRACHYADTSSLVCDGFAVIHPVGQGTNNTALY